MLLLRRVVGSSMEPALQSGRLIVASRLLQHYRVGDVVIAEQSGRELIKRISNIRIGAHSSITEIYLAGDNAGASTDSRSFGWLTATNVRGKVVWPRKLHRNLTN